MTRFVIDASVLAALALTEGSSRAAGALQRLLGGSALAPPLLYFEIRNVLIVSERRGRLTDVQSERFLQNLKRLPIEIDNACEDARLLALAREHKLTIYDASYLELAVRQRLPLATLDAALERAARAEGVGIVGSD